MGVCSAPWPASLRYLPDSFGTNSNGYPFALPVLLHPWKRCTALPRRRKCATSLITAWEERKRVAELNLVAGKRAKISEAYASALSYFAASEAFLAEDCWEQDHALAFELVLNHAEYEFPTGLLTEVELPERRLAQIKTAVCSFRQPQE